MNVSKIFNKLMSFTLGDFPKNETELARFRSALVYLQTENVKADVQSDMDDRLHSHLSTLGVDKFPKSLVEHHNFNGQLLSVAFGR